MKKRLISLLLAALSALSCFCFSSSADDGRVEIVFKVGDSTLTINGSPVTVETPYVVGAGVTLVPVRVITEAFGAEVGWDGDTRTVTLQYPDVSIVLQIGNPVAELNGFTQTLLSPPELTANGVTMVPLRFISESFGADVSYDEATQGIKVVKETEPESEKVVEAITEKYIGDSYYGWAVNNLPDMQVVERSFDGTYTVIANSRVYLDLEIFDKNDYNLAIALEEWKEEFYGFSLSKTECVTSPETGYPYLRVQAMDKERFIDIYEITTDKYLYRLMGYYLNDSESKKEGINFLSSFSPDYPTNDVWDLSEVENGLRIFEMNSLGFSIGIPGDFIANEDDIGFSTATFYPMWENDTESEIYISIFSKSDDFTAQSYAQSEYQRYKDAYEDYNVIFNGKPQTVYYENTSGYEYSYYFDEGDTFYFKDFFFEVGNYIYNVMICLDKSYENKSEIIEKVFDSIKAEEIDFDAVGPIIPNTPNDNVVYSYDSLQGCTLSLPRDYYIEKETSEDVTFIRNDDSICLMMRRDDISGEDITLEEWSQTIFDLTMSMGFFEIVEPMSNVVLGENEFCKAVFAIPDMAHTEYYITMNDSGVSYCFAVAYEADCYTEDRVAQVQEILSTLKLL